MAYIPSSGSVVAFQGNPSVLQTLAGLMSTNASVITVGTAAANQSVSGTVHVDNFSSVISYQLAGSVLATSATVNPAANQSVSGTVQADIRGSVATVIIGGAIAASFTPPANQSVSGNVGISGNVTVVSSIAGGIFPISGSVATTVTNFPTTQNISGSVVATQGTTPWQVVSSLAGGIFPVSGSVGAVITNTNLNVGGSVVAFQGGAPWANTNVGSVITVGQGSIAVAIISGSIAATFTPPANQSVSGTVTTLQATSPWIVEFNNSSVLAVPVGSTVTVLQSASIAGTYAEDAGHSTGDRGIFNLNVRNDTLSSITSADNDYSPMAVGPTGEVIVANSPITKWVYGTTSIVSGPSVALIAAQGASIFTYVTGLNIVNPSGNNLTGNLSTGAGAASVLLYWTAPANGGSNMVFPNPLRSRDNTAILASISGVGSVYLSAQGFISKT